MISFVRQSLLCKQILYKCYGTQTGKWNKVIVNSILGSDQVVSLLFVLDFRFGDSLNGFLLSFFHSSLSFFFDSCENGVSVK